MEQISDIQEKEEEWVNVSYLSKVPFGLETGRGNGLVRETNNNDNNYVQLTPEGLFLMKGISPKSWIEKNLFVSADFELFVPHTSC